MVSRGHDINAFNAHRIYGPVMYPFLTTNWRFDWPTRGGVHLIYDNLIFQILTELTNILNRNLYYTILSLCSTKLALDNSIDIL